MTAPLVVLDAVVRLRDATPGTELLDGDGDRWTRTATGARYHLPPTFVADWDEDELDELDEDHGPFRMVRGAT